MVEEYEDVERSEGPRAAREWARARGYAEHGPYYMRRPRGSEYASYSIEQLKGLRRGTQRAKEGGFFTHPEAADEIIGDLTAEIRRKQRARIRRE